MRKSLSYIEQSNASKNICAQIESMDVFNKAHKIALYSAINGEIDLSYLRNSTKSSEKQYFLPSTLSSNTLIFLPITNQASFIKNKMGILEPDVPSYLAVNSNDLDIICLPVVAFDEYGARIGMGGGYYDKTLAKNTDSVLIGVAYDAQKQPLIHQESWDIPLNFVVTQTGIWKKIDIQKNMRFYPIKSL